MIDERGVSRAILARHIGRQQPGFNYAITRGRLWADELRKIAEFFGVSVNHFIDGTRAEKERALLHNQRALEDVYVLADVTDDAPDVVRQRIANVQGHIEGALKELQNA